MNDPNYIKAVAQEFNTVTSENEMKFVLISFPSARLDNAGPNAFVMWGFTDKYSWTNYTFSGSGAPLVFNENYQPKLAYYALIEILLEKISPKSKLTCESAH